MTSGELLTVGDRYVLDRALSSAPDSEVWLAHDDVIGRAVALKLYLGQRPADPGWRESFRRRGEQLAALSHPGIATVYEYGGSDDDAWLATAYVRDATPLSATTLDTVETTLDILGQAAMAISAAHDAGVAHGALSADHVLTRDARIVTVTGFAMTTEATPADDIRALGALGAELLSATRGDRPSGVDELVARLRSAAGGTTTWAAGDLGRSALALAASLAPAALEASVVPRMTQPDPEPVPPAYDDAERRQVRNKLIALGVIVVVFGAALLWFVGRGGGDATVPSVVDLPLSQAQNDLIQQGFRGESSGGNGTVISQSPQAGSQIKRGSTVTLTVASGGGS